MSGIGEHLFKEMLSAMEHRPIRDSIVRQSPIVQEWIETSIQKGGVDVTSDLIEDLISMNEIYEGTRPIFNQLVDFALELDANEITRDTAKFNAQVRGASDYGSLDTFFVQNNEIIPVDSPNRTPEKIHEAEDMPTQPHPLRESWNAVVSRFKEAELDGDEMGMKSAERTLERLREQITAGQPEAPKPAVPKPEVPNPVPATPKSDISRMDELDKRIDALPDSGVYTTEQQAELDAIDAELDDLDEAEGVYFADEDYA